MKISFIMTILLLGKINFVLADSAAIQCDWVGSDGHHYIQNLMETKDDYSFTFSDSNISEVKFSVSYNKILKTVDTSVKDETFNVEAFSTEWINEVAKGAHSAVRLNTIKGSFMISCSLH